MGGGVWGFFCCRWTERQSLARKKEMAKLCLEGIIDKNDYAWKTTFNLLDIMNKFSSKEAKTIVVDLALFYSDTCSNHAIHIWIQSHFTNKKIDELISPSSTWKWER